MPQFYHTDWISEINQLHLLQKAIKSVLYERRLLSIKSQNRITCKNRYFYLLLNKNELFTLLQKVI